VNLARIDQIAKAVLYEGYMLYPYRRSSVKNRQRWNFGVLHPKDYRMAHGGNEPDSMQVECLVRGTGAKLEFCLRFLHLQMHSAPHSQLVEASSDDWQEAIERQVFVAPQVLQSLIKPVEQMFQFAAAQKESEKQPVHEAAAQCRQESITGKIEISAERLRDGLFKVRARVGTQLCSVTSTAPAMRR